MIFYREVYRYFINATLAYQRLLLVALSPIVGSFSSLLIGLETMRAYGRVGAFQAAFRVKQAEFARAHRAVAAIERCAVFLVTVVCVAGIIVSVGVGVAVLAKYRIIVTPGTAGAPPYRPPPQLLARPPS